MRLIVAGSRSIKSYKLIRETLDRLLVRYYSSEIEIVCGECYGPDLLGKKYALAKRIQIKSFPADWDNYGRSAGFRRNEEMAKYATHCVCFWDERSKGTLHMINLAKQYGIKLKVINTSGTVISSH